MPGVVETPVGPVWPGLGFTVAHQKLELEIDFASRSLKGKTEITIHPHYKDLRIIRLNFRQGELKRLSVGGKTAITRYADPYESLHLYGSHYHQRLYAKIDPLLKHQPDPELVVMIPKSVRIEELDPFSIEAQNLAPGVTCHSRSDVRPYRTKPGEMEILADLEVRRRPRDSVSGKTRGRRGLSAGPERVRTVPIHTAECHGPTTQQSSCGIADHRAYGTRRDETAVTPKERAVKAACR